MVFTDVQTVKSDSDSTDRILLWAGEGMDLPAAKSAFLKICLTFGDEVNLLEDGTTEKNVDPWVQYLVPGSYSHPHYHQGLIGGKVMSNRALVWLFHCNKANNLELRVKDKTP